MAFPLPLNPTKIGIVSYVFCSTYVSYARAATYLMLRVPTLVEMKIMKFQMQYVCNT